MIAQARGRFIRVSPTKMRDVIDLIRGKDVVRSFAILGVMQQGPAPMVKKILTSAVNNAKQKGLTEDQLVVSRIIADKGPMWKRYRAVAFGRASSILKRTTHVTIQLDVKAQPVQQKVTKTKTVEKKSRKTHGAKS